MAKVEIKSVAGAVLYTADIDDSIPSGLQLRVALEKAASDRTNLYGADLRGANLRGADLYGANLRGANLRGADLYDADLYGANLYGADLRGADLRGADLRDANLYGAALRGAKLADDLTLVGERPVFTLGPIGSRSDTFVGYVTNQGLRVQAGCFFGAPEEFTSALEAEHGTNAFGREYLCALGLLKLHADLYKGD